MKPGLVRTGEAAVEAAMAEIVVAAVAAGAAMAAAVAEVVDDTNLKTGKSRSTVIRLAAYVLLSQLPPALSRVPDFREMTTLNPQSEGIIPKVQFRTINSVLKPEILDLDPGHTKITRLYGCPSFR